MAITAGVLLGRGTVGLEAIPAVLDELPSHPGQKAAKVMQVMPKMVNIDIPTLNRVARARWLMVAGVIK